ncbi:transglycosylase SLT domain-containing protein [Hahella ganghwensis]|uniref:transglycosylase SLT domain-containing protein n=1 Tax=Hahella ganghwensis TaxID=286420 RepID=UPI0003745ED1|nr:transglycosylase SLT domain-containing protein [Hahella ganghwensis]
MNYRSTLFFIIWTLLPFKALGDQVPFLYWEAAVKHGVSPHLIYAIALTESGRPVAGKRIPWPWTLNVSERPYYFSSREAAFNKLQAELEKGNENIAIGLMQVYWKYNHSYFSSPWEALDPKKNIDVGIQVLQFFYKNRGSYEAAVGAYYSPNKPLPAEEYKARVRSNLRAFLEASK